MRRVRMASLGSPACGHWAGSTWGQSRFLPWDAPELQARRRPAHGTHVVNVCCAERESLLWGGERSCFHFASDNTER